MSWRSSARALFTVITVLLTAASVVLLIAVVRQSLIESNPAAASDATTAAWTVAPLLIGLAGFAAWIAGGYIFRPVWDMRRDLTLSARTRAISDAYFGELEEITSLRQTLIRVLQELEQNAGTAEAEKRRVFALMEDLNEGIAQIGASGRFLHVNRAARKLLSLPNQPEGQMASTLIRHAQLLSMIERAASGDDLEAAEITFESRQLLVAPQAIKAHEPDSGAIISVVDLTELRRLESVRRDFVANVSHELKTPLTSIRGYTETLITDELTRADQVKFLEVILRNATRLQRIVEELLDLSRLESGGWTPAMQEVSIERVAREAWTTCDETARQKNIVFNITGTTAHAWADPEALHQVFTNIFENAVRYTPDGGSIGVAIHADGKRLQVDVNDTGGGIPAASLPRIFERFYRVDAARSRAEGGTGLGLAIVKHLLEKMGGSVTAQSTLGSGTTMHILLDRSAAE
jgi:two-component system phosphate regulon sensor histidine kinase PhoR